MSKKYIYVYKSIYLPLSDIYLLFGHIPVIDDEKACKVSQS